MTASATAAPLRHLVGRMEAHPDRDVFLFQHIHRKQQPAQRNIADDPAPFVADEGELPAQRIGGRQRGSAQQIDQVCGFIPNAAAWWRRNRCSPPVTFGYGVCSSSGAIVKQLEERPKCRIGIRQPQHHHLFESRLAMRNAIRAPRQPFFRRFLATVNPRSRELRDELQQQLIEAVRTHARREPLERLGNRARRNRSCGSAR